MTPEEFMKAVMFFLAVAGARAEQTAQLLRAIEGVGNRIDGLHERLDRLYENPPPRRTTRAQ